MLGRTRTAANRGRLQLSSCRVAAGQLIVVDIHGLLGTFLVSLPKGMDAISRASGHILFADNEPDGLSCRVIFSRRRDFTRIHPAVLAPSEGREETVRETGRFGVTERVSESGRLAQILGACGWRSGRRVAPERGVERFCRRADRANVHKE
jgi:hypothetical protein